MYFTFLDILDAVGTFMQRGGPVLWVIAWLLLIKWSLVLNAFGTSIPLTKTNIKNTLADWNARTDAELECASNTYDDDFKNFLM